MQQFGVRQLCCRFSQPLAQLSTRPGRLGCLEIALEFLQARIILDPAKRSKRRNRSASKCHTQHHSRQNIAKKMHSQHNPRNRNTGSHKKQCPLERRIKVTHYERHGERRHGMSGRKRKPIRRQNLRPAVRLQLARPRPLAQSFQSFEDQNPNPSGGSRCPDRKKPLRAPSNQQQDS